MTIILSKKLTRNTEISSIRLTPITDHVVFLILFSQAVCIFQYKTHRSLLIIVFVNILNVVDDIIQ